jgi:hypothetical protein
VKCMLFTDRIVGRNTTVDEVELALFSVGIFSPEVVRWEVGRSRRRADADIR